MVRRGSATPSTLLCDPFGGEFAFCPPLPLPAPPTRRYLLGLILLLLSAALPGLRPEGGEGANSGSQALFWTGMYMVALGEGGIKVGVGVDGRAGLPHCVHSAPSRAPGPPPTLQSRPPLPSVPVQPCVFPFGADQFSEADPRQMRQVPRYFGIAYAAM